MSLVDTIKPDREDHEDKVFQLICDEGREFTLSVKKRLEKGAEIYIVGSKHVRLLACVDGSISTEP